MQKRRRKKLKEKLENIIFGTAIFISLPFAYNGCKNYLKYNLAPIINYKVQKGDTLWNYCKAEGIDNKDCGKYIKNVLRANDFYISGTEKNIDSSGKLVEGRIVSLPDINRDGKVGK